MNDAVAATTGPTPGVPAPDVSVIVPAWGLAHLVGETLVSLQAQRHANWEAIVVDDGAPDDVAGALAPFGGDPRIRLLRTDNRGVSTARNRAIGHARAPLIALLDGDDIYEPDYLSTMIGAIRADEALGFVCCDATYFGEEERAGRRFSEFSPQRPPITLERVLRRDFNVFTACIVRLAAFDATGGYDGGLAAAEDFDLWLRMLEAGWQGGYVAQALVRYRRRAGSLSRQTTLLTRALARVYRAAERRLGDTAEGRTAAAMALRAEHRSAWEEGDALIRDGRVREGLRVLRAARAWRRSLRWSLAMPLMIALPALAGPILRGRQRRNETG
ncbi:glycosyltransferase family 2 protein [Sphingomonas solaris]|uniref:Glycosyltransferase n=1 Tax=Alterirhizorhabdus solaris TaxID=2529389 RepID=A0A558R1F5_9SPHN|nr:glycosyltransferase family A protein [Sphingomonas solaris]TVV73221.1 glycosyltransferase [Sphingomonas solaris]